MSIHLGIDNGATGTVGIINSNGKTAFFETPTKSIPDFTKNGKNINRIDAFALKKKILETIPENEIPNVRCLVERPFTAPVQAITYKDFIKINAASKAGFHAFSNYIDTKKKVPTVNMIFLKSSLNAQRAFEATIILMESMKIGFEVVDSKVWQKHLLGHGIKGSKALKEASKMKGIQLFPQHEELIRKHHDADGLLIARFCFEYYNQ